MSITEKIITEKKDIIQPKKMGLLVENPVYKPFRYPWCYDAWLTQQRIHWLPEEVPLGDDVKDWQKNLFISEGFGISFFILNLLFLLSSLIISMHSSTHSSHTKTVGPAINFFTSF